MVISLLNPKKKGGNSTFSEYYNPDLKDIKKIDHKICKHTGGHEFSTLRSYCKFMLKECLEKYRRYFENNFKSDLRSWELFNNKSTVYEVPNKMNLGNLVKQGEQIVQLFVKTFSNIYGSCINTEYSENWLSNAYITCNSLIISTRYEGLTNVLHKV